VTGSPATSIGWGLILFLVLPLIALVVFVLGLVVGGWWIGLIILAAYGIGLVASVALAGMAIGRWLLERAGRRGIHFAWALLLGVAIVALVGLIPIIGGLLIGVLMIVAFGGLVLSTFHRTHPSIPVAAPPPEPPPSADPVPG